jgi:outer membrane immunogenic protein
MKIRSALISCATLLMAATSFAADFPQSPPQFYRPTPVRPVAEWTGLYFGANGGYGKAHDESTVVFSGANIGGFTTPFGLGATELSGTQVSGTGTLSGGIAGGQIGFNWQSGAIVFGGEVDAQWSGQRSTFAVNCGSACTASETARIRSIVTARARIGYAFDGVMAYVTGGGVTVNVLDNLTMTIGGVTANFPSLSTTVLGWTAGAGVEVNLWGNWSAKLEYLYIGVNNVAATAAIPATLGVGIASEAAGYRDNIVRVGLNYRFGPSGGTAPLLARPVYSAADGLPAYTSIDARSVEMSSSTRPSPKQNVKQVAKPASSRPNGLEKDGQPALTDSADASLEANGLIKLPKLAGAETANTDFIESKPTKHSSREWRKTDNKDEELRRIMEICRGC